jgi:hypothetical protein
MPEPRPLAAFRLPETKLRVGSTDPAEHHRVQAMALPRRIISKSTENIFWMPASGRMGTALILWMQHDVGVQREASHAAMPARIGRFWQIFAKILG